MSQRIALFVFVILVVSLALPVHAATSYWNAQGVNLSIADKLFVDVTNSRVGIGTTSPETTLHVKGSSVAVNSGISLGTTDEGITAARFVGVTKVSDPTSIGTNSGFYGMTLYGRDSANEGSLAFSTWDNGVSSGERMVIDKSGNVGIGTTNPTAKLDVNGSAGISDTFTAKRGVFGTGGNNMVDALMVIDQGSTTIFKIDTSNKYMWYNDVGGKVGIGTISPSQKLDVAGNINVTSIGNISLNAVNQQIQFGPANNGTIYWDGTGLVIKVS